MTPDVNVLVAASRQDHPHHEPALAWLEGVLAEGAGTPSLAILPMVASGFLRLVTHPRVFIEPTPPESAWAFLRAVLSSHGVIQPPLGGEWAQFERMCEHHRLTANAISDAWIAAAAQFHHLHLVTFDKGFRKLLKPSMLTVLKARG